MIRRRKERKHKYQIKINLNFKVRLKKRKTTNIMIKYYVLLIHCRCAINDAMKHLRRN